MQLKQIYNKLTTALPGYRVRDSQLLMINAIAECFDNADPELKDGSNMCLIEAPTGTGKSLAYLLAGVISAQKLYKKLVVATATKTLQSQLVEKDIPLLQKHSGLKFSYGLAKGRGNYLCPYQLELAAQNMTGDMFTDNKQSLEQLQEIRSKFSGKLWDGDLDISPIHIDHKLKASITTDKERCLSYSCPYNQKDESSCPFYLNREKLKTCDVIVTNHSLLLADITVGSGSVLPFKPADYLLCVDEGHNLSDNAISSFSKSFELKHAIGNCGNLSKLIYNPQGNHYLLTDIPLCEQMVEQANNLITLLDEMLQLLTQNIHLFNDNQLILNDYLNPNLGTEFRDRFVNLTYVAGELYANVDQTVDKMKEQLKDNPDYLLESNLNKLGFYAIVVETVLLTSQYIINQDDSRYNANAKWIEFKPVRGHEDFVLNATPTHVGNLLLNKLWGKVHAGLITSATLAVGEDFRYYLHKLGLNLLHDVITLKLPTSFEYDKQAQIVVPRFKFAPDYATRDEFTNELSQYLIKTLNYTDGFGTLVLFFNRNQLIETHKMLPKGMQRNILLQTDFMSTQRLLNEHKKNIDEGRPSIIFGLNSFAEGVDLPSLYCIHVIITKLPFETHKNPQSMVEEYWVKYEKGNYFFEISMPETCIRLIQAAGRLIRDENDYGQLSICDNRLVTKNYGKLLLDALPRFNRKYNSEFINQSFAKIASGGA
jgi:ATP-dependent DNA helicase DinG